MKTYAIEKSLGNKIQFSFPLLWFVISAIMLLMLHAPSGVLLVWNVLWGGVALYFIPILFSSVTLNGDRLKVHCGLVCQKRILYSEIVSIGTADRAKEYIHKGNPAYSKNIVKIGYGNDQEIYISIRNPDAFIGDVENHRNILG